MPTPERRPSSRAAIAGALLPLAMAAALRAAPAQQSHPPESLILPPADACLDALPADAMRRVPVYLEADAHDPAARAILPAADLLVSVAAERLRVRLGAAPDQLPAGEPAIGWRDLGPGATVTLHRDGRFGWERAAGDGSEGVHRRAAGTDALLRTLADLAAEGERVFWPEGAVGDSARVRIRFRRPAVARDGSVAALGARLAVPVLSVAAPWESPVVVVREPALRYPRHLQQGHVEGTVVMRYVVDERGRADPETLRDEWPPDRPPLTGELGRHYRDFVAVVRRGLDGARFEPARVGGCPVRQLVSHPFEFRFR